MRRGALVLVALWALAIPDLAAAHGLGGIRDLPVPGWLFLVGGATVLVLSFLALGALWKEPKLHEGEGRPTSKRLQELVFSPWTRRAVQASSLFLFGVLWWGAAFGSENASQNLTPTFVYVLFWVGMVVVCIVLGNVWSVLSPWRAAADLVAWFGARLGWAREPRPYPERLGLWPAFVLLGAFIVLELVWKDPANPRNLAQAIFVYSVATWAGMAVYGRRAWLESGDGFSVYFGFLSRAALLGTRTREGVRELIVRKPFSGLTHIERRAGAVAFLALMLGSVAFDGLSRSSWWFERLYSIETEFSSTPASAERAVMLFNLAGAILAVIVVAAVYTLAVRIAEGVVGEGADFRGIFLCSLIPIAIVYALSHYLSLLVIQGQFAIPLFSDPFGKGWNLFGSAGYLPDLTVLTPNTTWYTQVIVLVAGHVVGLVVAHDRALAVSPSPRIALRTQYAMLALMVLYTVGGMWLLSLG